MKRRYKILGAIAVVLALGVLSLALAMSHTAPCGPSPPLPAGATPMKAIVHRCYGSPDVIRLEDIPKPSPKDDEILVRVHAASVNPLDWHYLEGTPYMVRMDGGFGKPEDPRLGVDFSGTVEAVGKGVTRFKPGDEVFGGKFGALAEYVAVREERAVALKPANISHEQAAAVAIAAITALQGLRDKGHLRAGQNVLVNGASGGVGTFAVQIAKSFGANVTGVCSTKVPTPPEAPFTRTFCPARRCPWSRSPWSAVMAAIATAAACSWLMLAGLNATARPSRTATYSASAPNRPPKTSSPGLNRVTLLPTASTVPEKSTPRRGSSGVPNPPSMRTM